MTEPAVDERPEPAPAGPRRVVQHPAFFACAVVGVALLLGAFGISGSSLGLYATSVGVSESEAGVLAGPARSIRSDEWYVRTPWLLRQVELGLPRSVYGGMGRHDAAVLADMPVRGWELLLRPHAIGYGFLGAGRAIALEWWLMSAVQVVGIYTLLVAVTRRVALGALAGLAVLASPATQWWSVPAGFLTIGYGSLAAGLTILGWRSPSRVRRLALTVPTGLAVAGFLATLYPPWQVGAALVIGPVVLAVALSDAVETERRRDLLTRIGVSALVGLGIGVALFGAFLIVHREAVETISATVYPGQRTSSDGGHASLVSLLGGAFDSFTTQAPMMMVNGTNQSENASGLLLLLPAGLIVYAAGRNASRRSSWWPLAACLGGGAVILSWMLLPLPPWAGAPLLLTLAPPSRLLLPAAFAGVMALALLIHHQDLHASWPARGTRLAATAAFAAVQGWAAGHYLVDEKPIDLRVAFALLVVVSVGVFLALGRRPLAGLLVLVAFSAWQASQINPIQRGVDPLTESPLRAAIDDVSRAEHDASGWVAVASDPLVKGTITAAGVNHVSGVSPYPDRAAWKVVDPSGAHETTWNRYAHVSFALAPAGSPPRVELQGTDGVLVIVDPCGLELTKLEVEFLVVQNQELSSCVTEVDRVPHGEGYVVIYARNAPK